MLEDSMHAIQFKRVSKVHGASELAIHQAWKDGELLEELFTLESLANCLEMPMSTMNGRYQRANLKRWMRPIITTSGRPIRAFPLAMLDDVQTVILTRNATINQDVNGSGVGKVKPAALAGELEPSYRNGKKFFRISSLALAFGVSESTMRKRLAAAGLMRKFETIAQNYSGGRPQRGIPEGYLGDVKRALEDGYRFVPSLERKSQPEYKVAQQAMQEAIVPHIPPGRMQAYDSATRAPVVPRKTASPDVDLSAVFDGMDLDALCKPDASAVRISAGINPAPLPMVVRNPDGSVVTESVNGVNATEVVEDESHIIARQAWEYFKNALVSGADEPSQADIAAVVDQMGLDAKSAERFKREVAAGRGDA